jgi:GTP diphosphokinase / guanosine-3',5'-bis(diphosphate) 3'-diphosphatase
MTIASDIPAAGAGRPASDIVRLLDAIAFAAERHRAQRRKDEEASPYINHPIALAAFLAGTAGVADVTVLQAAVLHDTIEDTDTSAEELRERFGDAVADIVLAVTDDPTLDRAHRKQMQVERAAGASREVALVKWADKICNLRDMNGAPPAGWSLERRREYFDWAKRVVDRLPQVGAALRAAFDAAYAARP